MAVLKTMSRAASVVIVCGALLSMTTIAIAGPIDGPKTAFAALHPNMFYSTGVVLVAGQPSVINVFGGGTSDLDLFVFDELGNLVAFDTSPLDQCSVKFNPRWTGLYRIEVRNVGPYFSKCAITAN